MKTLTRNQLRRQLVRTLVERRTLDSEVAATHKYMILGNVVDALDAVLPGVSIKAYTDAGLTQLVMTRLTDSNGNYGLPLPHNDDYWITATLTGYTPDAASIPVTIANLPDAADMPNNDFVMTAN